MTKCKSSLLSHTAIPHLFLLPLPSVRELPQQSLSGLATSTSLTQDLPSLTLNPPPRGTTQFKLPQGPLKHESSLLSLCVCAPVCACLCASVCASDWQGLGPQCLNQAGFLPPTFRLFHPNQGPTTSYGVTCPSSFPITFS